MQTIDIRTTQNVTIAYELAALRERILSLMIDTIIVVAMYIILLMLLISALGSAAFSSGLLMYFLYGLLPVVGFMAYHFLSEVLLNGQSWGKRATGIRVVRIDGLEPTLNDYLLRAIFHLPDTLLSLGVLGGLLISSSAKKQRLGDMAANTTVIRTRQQVQFHLDDILKISSIQDYQPQYTAVRHLSEQDMLLLKHLIARYRSYPNAAHRQALHEAVDHLLKVLDIQETPSDKLEFLRTLIRDYIVLTR
jgi:uncharacterized RDD family membrane protein YckC